MTHPCTGYPMPGLLFGVTMYAIFARTGWAVPGGMEAFVDLFWVCDTLWEMIIYLSISQKALFSPFGDKIFDSGLLIF